MKLTVARKSLLLAIAALCAAGSAALAQPSSVAQANARPFELDTVAPGKSGDSAAASAALANSASAAQATDLPYGLSIVAPGQVAGTAAQSVANAQASSVAQATALPFVLNTVEPVQVADTAAESAALAQPASEAQATALPFGLDIVAPVQTAGSDAESASFSADYLAGMRSFLNTTLTGAKIDDSLYALDPTKLLLSTESDVRVYFLGDSTDYHNTLGFNPSGVGIDSGDPKLIFPDASSSVAPSAESWAGVKRTASEPLLPGDFVDLGTFAAGSKLDFFLIADGAKSSQGIFTTVASANPDRLNHLVAFTLKDSPYLMFGFEDMMGGGDRDFNDVMFAIDIREKPALRSLTAAPEPSMWLTLGSMLALVTGRRRRRPA